MSQEDGVSQKDGVSKELGTPPVGVRLKRHGLLRRCLEFSHPAWNAVSVAALGLLLVEVNLLSSRHYGRFDFTQNESFSLSSASRKVLSDLGSDAKITCLLGKADPLVVEAKHLLTEYRAKSPFIRLHFLDPSRDRVQVEALKQTPEGLLDANGGVDADAIENAAFLIHSGATTWVISKDELIRLDPEGRPRARLEELITSGLLMVQSPEKKTACFGTDGGSLSPKDRGPESLSELRRKLLQSNWQIETLKFEMGPVPASCSLIALLGPERPLSEPVERALMAALESGTPLLLALDPVLGPGGRLHHAGLAALSKRLNFQVEPGFVLELDPKTRLPEGMGETFFTKARAHEVTSSVGPPDEMARGPVVRASQALKLDPKGPGVPLLLTSSQAAQLSDVSAPDRLGKPGEHILAAAFEEAIVAPSKPGEGTRDKTRVLVFGSSSYFQNSSLMNDAWEQNRRLARGSFSWLLRQKAPVEIDKPTAQIEGLSLTEASLGELIRYVMFWMPGTAALFGVFTLLRRRRRERRPEVAGGQTP